MTSYVAKRLLAAIPIVFGVATIAFFLLKLAPGDPAQVYLGDKADPAAVERLRESWGLDQPLLSQYVDFLADLVRGRLGESFAYKQPVVDLIGSRLGPTMLLMLVSILLAVCISIPVALWVTLSRSSAVAFFVRSLMATMQGMPLFFVGSLLITSLALGTGLFPVGGYGEGLAEHLHSLLLPGLAVALSITPTLVRSLVASLTEALEAPYVDFATAKGLPRRTVIKDYALRNSSISTVSILGIQVGSLVGGALVVENVFAIPGLGTLLLQSVIGRDFPVVLALTVVFGVLVVLVYLLTDVVYGLLDPRVRVGRTV